MSIDTTAINPLFVPHDLFVAAPSTKDEAHRLIHPMALFAIAVFVVLRAATSDVACLDATDSTPFALHIPSTNLDPIVASVAVLRTSGASNNVPAVAVSSRLCLPLHTLAIFAHVVKLRFNIEFIPNAPAVDVARFVSAYNSVSSFSISRDANVSPIAPPARNQNAHNLALQSLAILLVLDSFPFAAALNMVLVDQSDAATVLLHCEVLQN